jgi:hypothetical protein
VSYSTDRADLLTSALGRMASLHAHQLAGQAANIDFWVQEASGALQALDEYPERFRRLHEAQVTWVEVNQTRIIHCPICRAPCEFGAAKPSKPRRVPSKAIENSRGKLRKEMRHFLLRLFRLGVLGETTIREQCEVLQIPLEPEDFTHES